MLSGLELPAAERSPGDSVRYAPCGRAGGSGRRFTPAVAVEAEFDRDEEDFSLTVASAGIGSELKSLRQYRKLIGREVEAVLKDGSKLTAVLKDASAEALTLSYSEKVAVEGKKRRV